MKYESISTYATLAAMISMSAGALATEPIHIGFLWHMHQPRYVPDLDPFGSDPFFSFSVPDIHNQRFGPYTNWPANAVNAGSSLAHLGAHVSFSGALIENLNALESSGINGGLWSNWSSTYASEQSAFPSSNYTTLGNPRLEMIGFGYFHPLMPLIDEKSIVLQIALHQRVRASEFSTPADSAGLFPPETAFSTRMIPALVEAGLDWVLVDNIHFDRACLNYPHTDSTGIARPNRADQLNPDPATTGGSWIQLQNLWAPSQVSAPFGYQPHIAQHIDPDTGAISQIVAVPAARYEGNEDGRGGYGAFLYDQVMDAYLGENTDPDHPMFVVLHHDGDNFGGGSEGYYHHNFQNMVNWVTGDPDYDVTTVDDYLDRFPVNPSDIIHIEDGSWAGADSGDPEFKKWLGGDVSAGATSPDINSWAAITQAQAHVLTLDHTNPINPSSTTDLNHIINATGDLRHRAWRMLLVGQASDYWYWDGTEVWDSNPTRAANAAIDMIDSAYPGSSLTDQVGPAIFVPQREPYNPGAIEFGSQPQPSDFEVWTLVADYNTVSNVTLYWRTDNDGQNPLSSTQNETFAGGPEVGAWNSIPMSSAAVPTPQGVLQASRKATRYGAMITDQSDVLIDYYVQAQDNAGNISRSDIKHVWVGSGQSTGPGEGVTLEPSTPIAGEPVTITYDESGTVLSGAPNVYIHWGIDNWSSVFEPDPVMSDPDNDGIWEITLNVPSSATQLDMVFNNGAGTWDNNNGADWHFSVDGTAEPDFTIDGSLDPNTTLIANNNGIELRAALRGSTLYLATNPASGGLDRFIVVADEPGAMTQAMWGKSGQVAQWSAFVGNENDNNFAGWFDNQGAAQVASGAVLEATLDLEGEFGSVPDTIHVCVLSFGSADGSTLEITNQVPVTQDGDGNVEADEFAAIETCDISDESCCPADLSGDGALDFFDVSAFLQALANEDPIADFTDDGSYDFFDVSAFLQLLSAGCP